MSKFPYRQPIYNIQPCESIKEVVDYIENDVFLIGDTGVRIANILNFAPPQGELEGIEWIIRGYNSLKYREDLKKILTHKKEELKKIIEAYVQVTGNKHVSELIDTVNLPPKKEVDPKAYKAFLKNIFDLNDQASESIHQLLEIPADMPLLVYWLDNPDRHAQIEELVQYGSISTMDGGSHEMLVFDLSIKKSGIIRKTNKGIETILPCEFTGIVTGSTHGFRNNTYVLRKDMLRGLYEVLPDGTYKEILPCVYTDIKNLGTTERIATKEEKKYMIIKQGDAYRELMEWSYTEQSKRGADGLPDDERIVKIIAKKEGMSKTTRNGIVKKTKNGRIEVLPCKYGNISINRYLSDEPANDELKKIISVNKDPEYFCYRYDVSDELEDPIKLTFKRGDDGVYVLWPEDQSLEDEE